LTVRAATGICVAILAALHIGIRANEQRVPGSAAQKAARRSKEDTIGVLQPRTSNLTTKNRKLVPEHHDLELLELTRAQTQRRHRKRTPKQQIHQRHKQEQTPSTRMRSEVRLYGSRRQP